MRIKTLNEVNAIKCLLYCFGLLLGTDVVYFFKIGNTFIHGIYVISLSLIVWEVIRTNSLNWLKLVDFKVKFFISVCILSVFNTMIYSNEVGLELDKYFKGIILLSLGLLVYSTVLVYQNQIDVIFRGIKTSFVLNMIYSIYQFIGIPKGYPFTDLHLIFPQEGYGLWEMHLTRVFGFFREPSHMMPFLIFGSSYILFSRKIKYRKIYISVLLFVLLVSTSSNAVFVLLSLLISVFSITRIKNSIKLTNVIWIISFLLISLILTLFIINFDATSFSDSINFNKYITQIADGLSIGSNGNHARYVSIKGAISVLPKYIIGAGYNMSATIMIKEIGDYAIVQGATYNGLLTVVLEIGILGLFSYMYLFVTNILQLLRFNFLNDSKLLAISLFFVWIAYIMSGYFINILLWFLLGLSNVYINKARANNENSLCHN